MGNIWGVFSDTHLVEALPLVHKHLNPQKDKGNCPDKNSGHRRIFLICLEVVPALDVPPFPPP